MSAPQSPVPPPQQYQPLRHSSSNEPGSFAAADGDLDLLLSSGNLLAKRIILGMAALVVSCLAYKFFTVVSCVQTLYDTSIACRTGFGCDAPRTVPCTDALGMYQMGADSIRSAVELGRANLFWPFVRFLVMFVLNFQTVGWAARTFLRVRISNDSWLSVLFTLIALGPDLFFSMSTPLYTDMASSNKMIKDFASSFNVFAPFVSLIFLVWPLAVTIAHYYVSVYGSLVAMQKARRAALRASDFAQQGYTAVRDTAVPIVNAIAASAPGAETLSMPETVDFTPPPPATVPEKSFRWAPEIAVNAPMHKPAVQQSVPSSFVPSRRGMQTRSTARASPQSPWYDNDEGM